MPVLVARACSGRTCLFWKLVLVLVARVCSGSMCLFYKHVLLHECVRVLVIYVCPGSTCCSRVMSLFSSMCLFM